MQTTANAVLIGSHAARRLIPWRETADWDLYADAAYFDKLQNHPSWRTLRTGRNKLLGMLDRKRIDCTLIRRTSWTHWIMEASRSGEAFSLAPDVPCVCASPSTLMVIQDVLSHWPRNWQKHTLDYLHLKRAFPGVQYSAMEHQAWQTGMATFSREFPKARPLRRRGVRNELLEMVLAEMENPTVPLP